MDESNVCHSTVTDIAPIDTSTTSVVDTVRCPSCGTDAAPHGKGQCSSCGKFLPSNTASLVHGGRRLQLGQGSALDVQQRLAKRDRYLADLGGPTEVSATKADLLELATQAVQLADVMWAHIEAVGPLTKAGRRRAAVDLYLAASGRAERLLMQLGLERRTRQIEDPLTYLQDRMSEQTETE